MAIPIAVLGLLVLMGLLSRSLLKTSNRPIFLILLIFLLLIMSGLRGNTVGADTIRYYEKFTSLLGKEYSEVSDSISIQKEPEFYMLSWAFGRVIPNVQVWFAFVSLVYLIGVALICYWESPDYSFSMLYIYCMGLFFFSMTGLRQTLALGFVLVSYYFLVKRKLIPFLLLVFLASRFHRSALVFAVIYPFANFKSGWMRLSFGLIAFIVVLVFKDSIGSWMMQNIPDDLIDQRLSSYMGSTTRLNGSGFLIQFLMLVFCLRYRKNVVSDVPHREALYNLASIGLIFEAASISIAEFFRIGMYFNWSYMVLIPICIQYEAGERNYEVLRMAIIMALLAYFFYSTLYSCSVVPYTFFWAQPMIT